MTEKGKGLTAYLENTAGVSSAVFKWGFGNDVPWAWEVVYSAASAGTKGILAFYGYIEEPMPDPDPNDQEYVYYWKNIPSYVHVIKDAGDQTLHVSVDYAGSYTARLYYRSLNKYILYAQQDFSHDYEARLMYPAECTFWVVIYRKITKYSEMVTYDYLGDEKFPYPPFPYQRE